MLGRIAVAACAIAAFALVPAGAHALRYQAPAGGILTEPVPDGPISGLATGDFNGDGRDDVARVGPNTRTFFVYLGQANGSFTRAGGFGGNSSPGLRSWIGSADLNDDDKVDLVMPATADHVNTLETYLGNGDGTFGQAPSSTAALPVGVAAALGRSTTLADVNADGDLDALVGMRSHQFAVALGNGDGSFGAATPINVPTAANGADDGFVALAVGDYNGDDDADVALVQRNASDQPAPTRSPPGVYLAHGDGTGSFAPVAGAVRTAAFDQPFTSAASISLNGGNYDDLTLTQPADGPGSFESMLGGPSGLGPNPGQGSLDPGWDPNDQVVADVDKDGDEDVVVALTQGSELAAVLSDGTGNVSSVTVLIPGVNPQRFFEPSSVGVADFDGDGFLDLAGASNVNISGADGISVVLAAAAPSVTPTAFQFPMTPPGQTSATTEFAVSNDIGAKPLPTMEIVVEGEADQFEVDTSDCGASLPAGASCTIEAAYAPTQIDVATANVEVRFGGVAPPLSVSLFGETGDSELTVDPPNLADFGRIPSGFPAGESEVFTLGSAGELPAEVVSAQVVNTVGDSFSLVDADACNGTIAPGDTCELTVDFRPSIDAAGEQSADLEIEDTRWPGDPYMVALRGDATTATHTLTPGALSFGATTIGTGIARTPQSAALRSTGNGPLPVAGYAITGPDAASFKAVPGQCPAMVPAVRTCPIRVTFDPTSGPAGTRRATLNLDMFSETAAPRSVSLSGVAVAAAPRISLTLDSPKKAKRGKTLKVKATVKNIGSGTGDVTLDTAVPKKFAKASSRVALKDVSPGSSASKTLQVKVKKSAKKGKNLKVVVTASVAGGDPVSATRTVKIR